MEKNQKRAMGFGLGTVLLWSTVATAFKLSLRDLTPVQMLLIAALASVVVLAIVLTILKRWRSVAALSGREWLKSFGYGAINPLLYYLVLFAAFDRLPAQEAQPLNYTWALVLAYLSVPFLGQRLHKADVIAGLICYSGVLVIATRGELLSLEFADPIGVGLAIGSTFIWASYWILNTRDTRDPMVGLFLNFLCGLPLILVVCLITDGLPSDLTNSVYAALYVGAFEMGVAFVFWSMAMKLADNTSAVSNLIFISPFLSLVFIYLILGEVILSSTYVGLALIIAGLWFQQSGKPKQKPQTKGAI